MVAVLAVADGTDGEDNMNVGTVATEEVDGATQVLGTLVDGELLFLKKGGGTLLAVVYYLTSLFQAIDVVGAEGEEDDAGEGMRK